ncbi:aldo/keto reductase [Halolamina salifodinae]|uniref:Aryl-alcohol dehydrogenase-like predicted oxidoreductase n=1 Tax=Halolamina salifodinae TaxID=1202767 RepID=A0A8T4GU31_9EURY|nr:aldo/keto reductase [Halolamina salifodinae]MBP1985900.1 aryl-alcohol dehydrogenase-like predicted oxidoreductase [Halolamina salifodinae]
MATHDATWRYRDRFGDRYGRTYFRRFGPGVVSSIGAGSYRGAPTVAVDERHHDALVTALENGCNVLDTAPDYRCGRAERVVGDALAAAAVDREAVALATKGGFVPFDGERPPDPSAYVREQFIETGLVDPADLARGSHAMTPDFLDAMLDRSLDALGVDSVDCYYVHNPETQLEARSREDVYDQLRDAFEYLEGQIDAGRIGRYGVASWEAFRVPEDHDQHLSLSRVLACAESAGKAAGGDPDEHGLEALQLPFNVHMADAFTAAHHADPESGEAVSALEFAHREGLSVAASSALMGGDLVGGIPEEIAAELAGDSPAQRAINFARSAPAVVTALVGMGRPSHVREDLAAGTFDPLGASAFDAVFE